MLVMFVNALFYWIVYTHRVVNNFRICGEISGRKWEGGGLVFDINIKLERCFYMLKICPTCKKTNVVY
jgi:hypothetical protein